MAALGRVLALVALGAVIAIYLTGAVVLAQQGLSTYEQIEVGATAVGIATTTTNPTGRSQMNTCTARVETASVRWRDDGTAPTASAGNPLDDDNVLAIPTNVIARAIQFIRTSGTSAYVHVRCYP